ncbi:hypothetical protein AHAS_Ahas01G0147700 [Arachis hypogaea]
MPLAAVARLASSVSVCSSTLADSTAAHWTVAFPDPCSVCCLFRSVWNCPELLIVPGCCKKTSISVLLSATTATCEEEPFRRLAKPFPITVASFLQALWIDQLGCGRSSGASGHRLVASAPPRCICSTSSQLLQIEEHPLSLLREQSLKWTFPRSLGDPRGPFARIFPPLHQRRAIYIFGCNNNNEPITFIFFAVTSKQKPSPLYCFGHPGEALMTGTPAVSSLRAAFSYCVQQVRSYDYHHYLCLLELPPSMRKAAFALRALNVETSRAMDVASDTRIGLMRLVWWQEAIDKMYSNKLIEHPTAQALSSVIAETKLSKTWLKRSVEARINDARREDTEMPETIQELEKYAEDTVSTMLYLTLQAGGINSTAADHAASHIGKASGILLLLKSLPYHASRNRHFSYIPTEVAFKHGLIVKQGGRDEVRLDPREGLRNAVFDMASVANAHLQKARQLAKSVPAEAVPVLLPAVPAEVILNTLSKFQFDVFDSRLAKGVLGIPPLWYQLKLKWVSWRGKY